MLIVIHLALPAMGHQNLSVFSVSRVVTRSRVSVSTTARMVITAIRSGRSVLHARLDVPPVAAINA